MGGSDASTFDKKASQGSAPRYWLFSAVLGVWMCGSHRCQSEPRSLFELLIASKRILPPARRAPGCAHLLIRMISARSRTHHLQAALADDLVECPSARVPERPYWAPAME
jgi:hypothetical protein